MHALMPACESEYPAVCQHRPHGQIGTGNSRWVAADWCAHLCRRLCRRPTRWHRPSSAEKCGFGLWCGRRLPLWHLCGDLLAEGRQALLVALPLQPHGRQLRLELRQLDLQPRQLVLHALQRCRESLTAAVAHHAFSAWGDAMTQLTARRQAVLQAMPSLERWCGVAAAAPSQHQSSVACAQRYRDV